MLKINPKMIRTFFDLLLAALVVTILVVVVSTSSNLLWLSSLNMPIDFNLVTSTFLKDVVGMNFNSQIPLYLIISIPLILFLFCTKLISRKILINRTFPYVLAGGMSMLFLMIFLPFALDNLEPISGSRTNIGKLCMTICGCLGGYIYSLMQTSKGENEI